MLSGPLLPLEDSAREGRLQRLRGVRAAGAMMLCVAGRLSSALAVAAAL